MKKIVLTLMGLFLIISVSCTDDLNTDPKVELTLDELLQQDPNAVQGILSRLYGSFALSGPNGPESSDISDNAGESPFLRGIINLQDFTADGMKNRWGDDGLDQLTTTSNWDENNKFFRYLYNRIYYTIPQCNNLLSVLESVEVDNKEGIIAEVRFIRALAYYYLIDAFGKGVLATEENFGTSSPLPEASRAELFDYTESELVSLIENLPASNEYGRANKSVGQMLLAKLYLNAEVYVGTAHYSESLAQIESVINNGSYQLDPDYVALFSADNDGSPEIIFPLIADAITSQSFGNTTYIINGDLSTETMSISEFGAAEGWTGHRATEAWYGLYCNGINNSDGLRNCDDDRAQLFWIGTDAVTGNDLHSFTMTNYKTWTDGYPSIKFRNTNFNGPQTAPTAFSSTDFPLFRLADAYLIYAECTVRGAAGGNIGMATQYVNDIRTRSNASTINQSELTLSFIIDERARELNLEGHRRTDLIRFGLFTGGNYVWPWKGNVQTGTSIPDTYKLFPIPLTALEANPNLNQNTGY